MKYTSTRNNKISINASEAILKGLSEDGGLFVPIEYPDIYNSLNDIKEMNYTDLSTFILKYFIPEFTETEIHNCAINAYKNNFNCTNCVEVRNFDNISFLELFHGPTLAFKDMALTIMPHLMNQSKETCKFSSDIAILTATSGDTGKAALEGFKNIDGIKIAVFFPENGVSEIQKLQMRTQTGNNVYVSGIYGNFDDAQNAVKTIFSDRNYNKYLNSSGTYLSSANSINLGRLLPQIIYYIYSYAELLRKNIINCGEKINFVVPTGNFGDILAGYYAKKMGLPINKLICASNDNNVLYDFFNTGIYDKNRDLILTESPSMDILISSNLERLLFDIYDGDSEKVSDLINSLYSNGKYSIPEYIQKKLNCFKAEYADSSDVKKSIYDVYAKYGYVIDTHTAVAYSCYQKYIKNSNDDTKAIILSTASPYKFASSVVSALGYNPSKNEFDDIDLISKISKSEIPESIQKLKTADIIHKDIYSKHNIKDAVSKFLDIRNGGDLI